MLVGCMIQHKINNDTYAALMRGVEKMTKLFERTILRRDRPVIGDVIAIVPQGRRKERKQPETIDAEPLDMVEFLQEAAKVSDPIAISVVKRFDVKLVKDCVLEP